MEVSHVSFLWVNPWDETEIGIHAGPETFTVLCVATLAPTPPSETPPQPLRGYGQASDYVCGLPAMNGGGTLR